MHYISIPVGFIFIFVGLKTRPTIVKFLKINTNSQTIFILTGVFLVLLAFPVVDFISEIIKRVK